ncbi:MAG TPA: hypothetical protein VFG46_16795, partial [Chryseolinea sp.]|nr:hypothetical protein [Chryseolinea sp.]
MRKYSWICLMVIGISVHGQIQNSVPTADSILSFQEAKGRLIKANLSLLASYYEVNIAKAGV